MERAFVFDLDGVVVRTDHFHFTAWKALADSRGWSFNEEVNVRLRGISRMASLQVILDYNGIDLPDDEKTRLATQKNDDYRELLTGIDESAAVEGAIPFLRKVRDRGFSTALGSSSRNATTVLEALGIGDLFDAIVTGNDIERSKPDPQVFLLGAERLGVLPGRCIVFEDAKSGVEAALAAGMVAIGFGDDESLRIAHHTVKGFDEIDIDELLTLEP